MEANKKPIPIVDRFLADAAGHAARASVTPNELAAELRILSKNNNVPGVRKLVAAFIKWERSVSTEKPGELRTRVLDNVDFACRVADATPYGSGEITSFYRKAIKYCPNGFQKK